MRLDKVVNGWLLLSVTLATASCGGSSVTVSPAGHDDSGTKSIDANSHARDTGSNPHDVGSPDGSPVDGGLLIDAEGAVVRVLVVAEQTPTSIPAGEVALETPVDQRVGILGLTLLKSASDPTPLVVFSHAEPIDTPYNAGSSTVVGVARASALVGGTYTIARVPAADVKFTVAGTYHVGVTPVSGDFTDTIALSTGFTVDGATRSRGWWSTSFSVAGMTEGLATGTDAVIAQPGATSNIGLDLSGPVAAYVFPVSLVIPEVIDSDLDVVFTVNTYKDFHWQDENEAGYEPGVFDVSAGSFEPVTQLGANGFTISIGPSGS